MESPQRQNVAYPPVPGGSPATMGGAARTRAPSE